MTCKRLPNHVGIEILSVADLFSSFFEYVLYLSNNQY